MRRFVFDHPRCFKIFSSQAAKPADSGPEGGGVASTARHLLFIGAAAGEVGEVVDAEVGGDFPQACAAGGEEAARRPLASFSRRAHQRRRSSRCVRGFRIGRRR